MNSLWALIGDFNAILNSTKRKDGSHSPNLRDMSNFVDFVQRCELINAGYQGPYFTWKQDNLKQHLNKMLINMHWRTRFEEGNVPYLAPLKSNHSSILVKFASAKRIVNHRRLFHFLVAWLLHEDFLRFISLSW